MKNTTVRKRVRIVVGAGFVALLIVTMCATELTRAFVRAEVSPPIALPRGVDIRYSDRLVSVIGKGTPNGRANAVTLGYVIVVSTSYRYLSAAEQARIIRHELMHVQQRRKYWRLYLPLYGLLYLVRGYTDHPFERDAGVSGT